MRALLERSNAVRMLVVAIAAVAVLGLVQAADAGGDPGLRRDTFLPAGLLSLFGLSAPAPPRPADREPVLVQTPAPRHARPRRIWAAAHGRPLRIALDRRHRVASSAKPASRVAARRPRAAAPAAAFRLVPPPSRTPLVSIYADRTLRTGDAVMLDDGLHVFRDDGFWPHRPRDFVRLRSVAGLDWHLRRTLQPYDNNPPTRWTSIMVPPA